MKIKVFSPSHVTGFFDPYIARDPRKSGSRGAGFSLSLGVMTEVEVDQSAEQRIEITINGKKEDARTTKLAIKNLIRDAPIEIKIRIEHTLPISQGFGLSGAGALSAAIGVARLVGLTKIDAIESAHCAEVLCRTGLGDVIAESFGGIEIRKTPGLPPWGMIEHIPGDSEVVLCVLDEKLPTPSVLGNTELMRKIRKSARYCLSTLLEKPSLENLIKVSYRFARDTGLAKDKVIEAIEMARSYGLASMCMLGNSVFAVGETEKLVDVLSIFGKTYRSYIDQQGARVVEEKRDNQT
ncbi:MAG: hypothetical protein DRN00_00565 [Thermoplasmata archaeon]|nr:MAG: hypothetical protein DRN00_00565 [Thermoplasmata archaeon]